MRVVQAIEEADALLPGNPVESGLDPRWQAIIRVGEFVETDPDDVWRFIARWGGHEQEDLRDAIATVLLEHLLEYHFKQIFPRVERAVAQDRLFADMFCRCWRFGQSCLPENAMRFDHLKQTCRTTTDKVGDG